MMGRGSCQILDKSGTLVRVGVNLGYCIQYTVYKGISTIMGFCQVEKLGVEHLKGKIDFLYLI